MNIFIGFWTLSEKALIDFRHQEWLNKLKWNSRGVSECVLMYIYVCVCVCVCVCACIWRTVILTPTLLTSLHLYCCCRRESCLCCESVCSNGRSLVVLSYKNLKYVSNMFYWVFMKLNADFSELQRDSWRLVRGDQDKGRAEWFTGDHWLLSHSVCLTEDGCFDLQRDCAVMFKLFWLQKTKTKQEINSIPWYILHQLSKSSIKSILSCTLLSSFFVNTNSSSPFFSFCWLNVHKQWRNMDETIFKCIYVIRNMYYVHSTWFFPVRLHLNSGFVFMQIGTKNSDVTYWCLIGWKAI